MLQLEIPHALVIECCQIAKEVGIPVVLDAGPAQQFALESVHGVDILTPNETEASELAGIEVKTRADAERAAETLQSRSRAKAVVVKLGAAGALLMDANGTEYFPAHKIKAVDPTAAGDAFTAAMTLRYLETRDLRGAVAYANLAGALATTRMGAIASLPTAHEIEEFRSRLLTSERRECV
jgi:ribokinase